MKPKAITRRAFALSSLAALALSSIGTVSAAEPPIPKPDAKPADMTKPVKVFLIMGQSNAVGMGNVAGDKDGTLEKAVKTEKLYPYGQLAGTDAITHLLPGLSSLALDVIDVDHMVSVGKCREILGPHVTIGGNLDPVADILRGAPDSIRAKIEHCYREAGNPFIVNAGCEIPSATPAENLKALCEPLAYVS